MSKLFRSNFQQAEVLETAALPSWERIRAENEIFLDRFSICEPREFSHAASGFAGPVLRKMFRARPILIKNGNGLLFAMPGEVASSCIVAERLRTIKAMALLKLNTATRSSRDMA